MPTQHLVLAKQSKTDKLFKYIENLQYGSTSTILLQPNKKAYLSLKRCLKGTIPGDT